MSSGQPDFRALPSLGASVKSGPPPAKADDDGGIRLVTQNMYVGSSNAALAAAQTPQQLLAAVATIYNNILASKDRPSRPASAFPRCHCAT